MITVQSDVTAKLTDSRKQTTPGDYLSSKHAKKYSLRRRPKRGRGRNRVTKSTRKKGIELHPIPIEKPVSNKKPSLISSTRKGKFI